MADVSSPAIRDAYDKVRDDKEETNWLLLEYENDKSDTLLLSATGMGGLTELKTKLQPDQAAFAYVRISYSNDAESLRSKFILITYIGPKVKIMRKAKLGVHSGDVKNVLRNFSVEVSAAGDEGDLDEESIVARLRKAGGASYDKA